MKMTPFLLFKFFVQCKIISKQNSRSNKKEMLTRVNRNLSGKGERGRIGAGF